MLLVSGKGLERRQALCASSPLVIPLRRRMPVIEIHFSSNRFLEFGKFRVLEMAKSEAKHCEAKLIEAVEKN